MTDDNSNNEPVDINLDNLDNFSNLFFGQEQPEPVDEPESEDEEIEEIEEEESAEEDDLATEEDDEDTSEEEDEDEDESEEDEPKSKRNRKSFQERLNEVYADKKSAERERDALRRELEQLRASKEEIPNEQDKPLRERLPVDAPKPDAVDEKGEPLYPLGEFDPLYIKDLTKFTIEQEMKATKERQLEEARQREFELAQTAIQQHWQENLVRAEEELPDIREKITNLVEVFQGLEQSYGEYLASTLMSCDNGPEIMYYLSENIGEAQKIVASGPAAATRAIGRLEAQFIKSTSQEQKRNKRVSDAPKPPEQRARGTNGKFAVRPDTNDLDAFEREFYKGS